MEHKRKQEILGISFIVISICLMVSLFFYNPILSPEISRAAENSNPFGLLGIYFNFYAMKYMGIGIYFLLLIPLYIGILLLSNKPIVDHFNVIWNFLFLGVLTSSLMGLYFNEIFYVINLEENPAGILGLTFSTFFRDIMGNIGVNIFVFFFLLFYLLSFFEKFSFYQLYGKIKNKLSSYVRDTDELNIENEIDQDQFEELEVIEEEEHQEECVDQDVENSRINKNEDLKDIEIESIVGEVEKVEDSKSKEEDVCIDDIKEIEKGDENKKRFSFFKYQLPKVDFLEEEKEIEVKDQNDFLKIKAADLKHALSTFGVSGEVPRVSPGPVISLFEVVPAEGVRVNKFTNLSDDLARVMQAQRIRVIAPIPGSKSVGIEIPNESPEIVYFKSIISSKEFIESESKLTIALGKNTKGEAFVFDLSKMPHLLVAGATGAGKSVCINTIICSILYKAKPNEVKFILIDPKKLELATYKSLVGYHLITAPNIDEYVMTTGKNAVMILDSAITEMERRFQVFADSRVRNIQEYHEKFKLNNNLEEIPFIVVLLDELADIMMTSGKAIEEPITRLAQKARAVGIHLVVATQRPSVDVITGLIKSNFPARIAFQVSSRVDSRTIIDQMGAEKLLGRGDMLFLPPGMASPIRIHNAYITLSEIEKIMIHINKQQKPNEIMLPEIILDKEGDSSVDVKSDENDELLKDAAILAVQQNQASVSLLQRKFRIGYSRAGRLIDDLENLGIISGYSGSKPREILVDYEYVNGLFDDTE